jgi:hypothetical protein
VDGDGGVKFGFEFEVVPIQSALFDDANPQIRRRYRGTGGQQGGSNCQGDSIAHIAIHYDSCSVQEEPASGLGLENLFEVVQDELLGVKTLQNDVPINNQSGLQGSQRFFRIVVPSGASSFSVTISGGAGDADLYVQQAIKPTLTTFLCRPWFNGNEETCTFTSPASGDWYIMLHGYAGYSGVTLRATYTMATNFNASGRVTTSSGVGLSAVTMTFSRVFGVGTVPASVQTTTTGTWTRSGFHSGTTYRVTPSRPSYIFSPASRDFSGASTALNFTAAVAFSASGRVTTSNGTGISGVTMTVARVSGTGALPVSVQTDANGNWNQSGFQAGTTYRVTPSRSGYNFTPAYRDFSAANTALNFTGASLMPTATTNAATAISASSATLNGSANPNGLSTTVYFQWGTSTAYGNTTPSQSIGSGAGNLNVTLSITGLSQNTTYHYRVVATSSAGSSYGANVSFTTTASSVACTLTGLGVGQTVGGALSTSDCRSPVRGSSYYADRYTFSGSSGQQVSILLTSSAFDTYLYLISPSGLVLAQDDDGGGGTNSRIPAVSGYYTLPSTGTYIVEVSSYSSNAVGNYSLTLASNAAVTIFQDNMENGIGNWSAQAPWAQTTAAAHSLSRSWTDSPSGNYGNNSNVSLWSPTLNFSGRSSITLSFWHRYDLESGYDYGNVWVTADNGATYTQVASFMGTNPTWNQATINLNSFAERPSVRVVFQLFSDASVTRDGWYLDDVVVTGN